VEFGACTGRPVRFGMVLFVASMDDFFRETLHESLQRARVRVSEGVQTYVVQLLTEFGRADAAFGAGDDNKPVMVDLLARAQDAEPQEAVRIYKHMGDRSLYMGGYFASATEQELMGRSYYVAIGGQAYAEVSARLRSAAPTAAMFAEMSDRFEALTRVLELMSLQPVASGNASADDLLGAYERYRKTGSAEARMALQQGGINVDDTEN
jgi:hypothetical protein